MKWIYLAVKDTRQSDSIPLKNFYKANDGTESSVGEEIIQQCI